MRYGKANRRFAWRTGRLRTHRRVGTALAGAALVALCMQRYYSSVPRDLLAQATLLGPYPAICD